MTNPSDVKLRKCREEFEVDYLARHGFAPCIALNGHAHKNMTYGNATTESEWIGWQAGVASKYKGKTAEEWCDETCKAVESYCNLYERNTRHTDHLLEMAAGALERISQERYPPQVFLPMTDKHWHSLKLWCQSEGFPPDRLSGNYGRELRRADVAIANDTLLTLQQHGYGKE